MTNFDILPQVLMILVAPFALMALVSRYAAPGLATKTYRAAVGQSGNASDDVVWTNAAYPLAALAALPDLPAFAVIWAAGVALAIGSAAYHATYERWAQRLDVAAMMTYLSAAFAATLTGLVGAWAWALVPAAAAAYSAWTWQIDSTVHVPLWALATIVSLCLQVGWGGLEVVVPVACGLAIERWVGGGDPDHWGHSIWHIGGAGSVALVLFLI